MKIQTPEMRLRNCLAPELLSDVAGYACTMASGTEMKFDHNGSHQIPSEFVKNADGTIGGDGAAVVLSANISATAKAAFAGVRASAIGVFRKKPNEATMLIHVGYDLPNSAPGFMLRESATLGSGLADDYPYSELSSADHRLQTLPDANTLIVCGVYMDGPAGTFSACTYGVEDGVAYREGPDQSLGDITANFGIEDGFRLFNVESLLGLFVMEHSAAITATDFFNYAKTTGQMTFNEWT